MIQSRGMAGGKFLYKAGGWQVITIDTKQGDDRWEILIQSRWEILILNRGMAGEEY